MLYPRVKHKRLEIRYDSVMRVLEFHDGKGLFLTNDFEKEIKNDMELEEFILTDEFATIFTATYCTNLDLLDDIRRHIAERQSETR